MNDFSNVILSMAYRRLQKNCGLDIFYKVDNGTYKFIIMIDNHGSMKIKTKENLNMIKEKICYLPEFVQGREYKFLTILLHGSKKDRVTLNGERNLISISMEGRDEYINCENCFKEELHEIKLCRKEEKLNRKKIALNDTKSKGRQNLPVLTILLIVASIVAFILPIEANDYGISGISIMEKRYITLFSYIFLHGGILHLANNCIAMGVIGSMLERKIGSLKYGILIIVSAVYG